MSVRQQGGTAFKALYKTYRWQQIRARQLQAEPLCWMCAKLGKVTEATVCNHINGHPANETEQQFWGGPFNSMCATCHSGAQAELERTGRLRGCDADGWPLSYTD